MQLGSQFERAAYQRGSNDSRNVRMFRKLRVRKPGAQITVFLLSLESQYMGER